ncbi:DUF1990 domain-containing protein [Gordonia sp. ABSL11-1]|uniref:DUF1990 family protein n=1 Tax=Gordonia sp. ABSL11-1 TaxID=3053924 RepID=UPI0025741A81|nr:DUF1990 domain-containing protein [Gordonia sp. ABSL11-1]MDL9947148.1 DUF1990 domain-containing protein [Gordonia sp. ABSL11-1]
MGLNRDMGRRWRPLDDDTAARLRAAPLTYPEVGGTGGQLPAGYHHLSQTVRLGTGGPCFDRARESVLTWRVQLGAGVGVSSSDPRVVDGAVAVVTIGIGRLGLRAPVRVVEVFDDGRRAGFSYGTLPGHPECGEERFLVGQDHDGTVTFTVTAFSRPHTLLARAGGPIGRVAQKVVTRRYLGALKQ